MKTAVADVRRCHAEEHVRESAWPRVPAARQWARLHDQLDEALCDVEWAVSIGDSVGYQDAMVELAYQVISTAVVCGVPIEAAWGERARKQEARGA